MSSNDYNLALKELLFKMADDDFIIGHRNSEWTGIGPVLEEDIAFGSLAQDKVGHAYNLYQLLEGLGEPEPDKLVFNRKEADFKCCHFVEYPIGEYDFSLMRHFLFDHADYIRYDLLGKSSYTPLANIAMKYRSEIKYHVFHADTWIKQLASGTEESKARMQSALNQCLPLAYSIFEPGPYEEILKEQGIFIGEAELETRWFDTIKTILENAGLKLPEVKDKTTAYGGRKGYHTEYFADLLKEFTYVYYSEAPETEW